MPATNLLITVPVCSLRKPFAREYLETERVPPPSTVYGAVLSLVGEEDRYVYQGTRIAIAIVQKPKVSRILRTTWRIKNRGNPLGVGSNRKPDYQEILTGLAIGVWIDEGPLSERIQEVFYDPESNMRFGGISLGESRDLVNDINLNPKWNGKIGLWLSQDETGYMPLPIWVDHVGSRGTRWGQFNFFEGILETPPVNDPRWIEIVPASIDEPPKRRKVKLVRDASFQSEKPAGKKRGRPPKSLKTTSLVTESIAQTEPEPTPADGNEVQEETTCESDTPQPKRRRGRPPKSLKTTSLSNESKPRKTAKSEPTAAVADFEPAQDEEMLSFWEMDEEPRTGLVYQALLGLGPIEKDRVIRTAAEQLREMGHVDFQRFRENGPLGEAIATAIKRCTQNEWVDIPARGYRRVVAHDPKVYTDATWDLCIENSGVIDQFDLTVDIESAIEVAAGWARDKLGMKYQRLRKKGHVYQGLHRAILRLKDRK